MESYAKIQSQFLKNKLREDRGLDALLECFSMKLKLDGFEFKTEKPDDNKIKITINNCPWHNIMVNSSRSGLSEKVGSKICSTEYNLWAKEFGDNINFKLEDQICKGSRFCILTFQVNR